MRLIRGIQHLQPAHRGCVLTIGNFDGVHLGHRRIIERVRQMAQEKHLHATVMLFEPQPPEALYPESAPARLMHLRDKLQALQDLGVDQVLCVRFDANFRQLTAQEFVAEVLVERLGVQWLVVGDDFRFGRGREGDFDYLIRSGRTHGFGVEDTPTHRVAGERVSSTRIREALQAGDLPQAASLLGEPFHISGRVRHGDRIGRKLGVPTANLALHRRRSPLWGVYAVRVQGIDDTTYNAVANVGRRPTVDGDDARLEVHLLDFAGDLYHRHLRVDFLHYLRPELRFDSLEILREAIENDIGRARAWFANAEGSI